MKNTRVMPLIAAAYFSILAIFFTPTMGGAGLPAPPPPIPGIDISAPPAVVVIPGSNVYFPPDVSADLLFYHGYWYRPYESRWYKGPNYNGPWGFVPSNRVPRALINLPHEYRRVLPGQERIPHGHLKKNWRTWERDKHSDKHDGKVQKKSSNKGKGHGQEKKQGKKSKQRDERKEQEKGSNK